MRNTQMNTVENKETRLNIRANSHQKKVIARAAKLRKTTISHFVLDNAYEMALAILAEETHFKLPEKKWQAFCEALDRKPKDIPALRKLLVEPSIFERTGSKESTHHTRQ